jgi:hypothetical protein
VLEEAFRASAFLRVRLERLVELGGDIAVAGSINLPAGQFLCRNFGVRDIHELDHRGRRI